MANNGLFEPSFADQVTAPSNRLLAAPPTPADAYEDHKARLQAWMDERRDPSGPDKYAGWDVMAPAVGPVKARMGDLIAPDPNAEYGAVLPFARDRETGAVRWALPSMARSLVQGVADLADGPSTGTVTPDAASALSMGAGSNLLARRGGALMSTTVPGLADRISTRVPTSVGPDAELVHKSPDYLIGREAFDNSGSTVKTNADMIRKYPGMRFPAGASDQEVASGFVNHVKDNLLWLHDKVPDDIRARSQLWYDGARNIADEWAQKYGLQPRQVAGGIAALSPQKDWFQNVDLARRLMTTIDQQADTVMTPEMKAWAKQYANHIEKGDAKDVMAKAQAWRDDVAGMQNTPFGAINNPESRAQWLRIYDEAHNPRTYPVLNPEGTSTGQLALTGKGVPQKLGWNSFAEINKSLAALSDPSLENISRSMGDMHKVRNFYNNIISPMSPHGEATMDTHAIAAGLLRPLGGSTPEVFHGLGLAGGKSTITGSNGIYPLYLDAYQRAAAERGILPRQMQSITWEALRGLFSPEQKRNIGMHNQINQFWQDYANGTLDAGGTRESILGAAGKIKDPSWHR